MHGRTMLLSLVVLVGGVGVARPELAELPLRVAAPAYDAVTQSSVRNLATALQSYGLDAGSVDGVTVEELAGWGWVPQDTTAVTIWVRGEEFRVVAQDVRPGASAFEYTTVGADGGPGQMGLSAARVEDPLPGVTIRPLTGS
ncbi:hypothetical protein [Cellulomonas cellasea]|uniref:Uncharacterized protein n=1 Tax=Cellulomonas cellasea TaxID=43670 RepID=A0A7W4YDB9_9CELL|nr:hypothetical protein [Cellulomonas cellasea]MBB2924386.1 hypothetical protein [Cellulomonas cellasea]